MSGHRYSIKNIKYFISIKLNKYWTRKIAQTKLYYNEQKYFRECHFVIMTYTEHE